MREDEDILAEQGVEMSMKPQGLQAIPEATAQLAKTIFPTGTLVMRLRDELGPIYTDSSFRDLFAKRGRGAVAPWQLAWVTVMQAVENLTDRQAAHAVRARIDWKYALGLSLEDQGFDSSLLSDFRQRLLQENVQDLVLEPILQVCRERGWIKAGGKQRTDSTAVLAHLRSLSSLESVGEAMRATLNAIAELSPDWLEEHVNPAWFDRYVHRFELARFPKEESKRKQLRQEVGNDVQQLLTLTQQSVISKQLQAIPEVQLLRQIFAQHYEIQQGQVNWRDGPAVSNEDRVLSPYDPDARSSRKRDTIWSGYKVHLTETCDQDPGCPHLVVGVETTPATTQDSEMLAIISEHLRERDRAPAQQYVDQGYTSGPQLVEQASKGTVIMGPVPAEGGWQASKQQGYAAHDFELDWDRRIATCPQGQQTRNWSQRTDARQQRIELIRFPRRVCESCPVREHCTQGSKQGRTLNLNGQEAHQALVQRRQEQFQPKFLQQYAIRAGIEGTISQGVRALGLRRTPYVGTAKTHLHHVTVAAGIDLLRIDAHLLAQGQGKPPRPTRHRTPFARVQERWNAKAA